MKNRHFFEDQVYTVSNHTVPGTPLFFKKEIQEHFISKMEFYLSDICTIYAYSLYDDEFKILLQMKDRASFEKYFLQKNPYWNMDQGLPETTYIFSQAMANMQASVAKNANRELERWGTFFNGRFKREVITSESEFHDKINELNAGKHRKHFTRRWQTDESMRVKAITSQWLYEKEMKGERTAETYANGLSQDLGIYLTSTPLLTLPVERRKFGYSFFLLLNSKGKKNK